MLARRLLSNGAMWLPSPWSSAAVPVDQHEQLVASSVSEKGQGRLPLVVGAVADRLERRSGVRFQTLRGGAADS